jgi:serine/threonine protein kinase/Tol biopolymer transport system component
MKPERWQQLDQLFHSALECEPAERAAFLDETCAGDAAIRKQVEALLAAHEQAGSFIEKPALEIEARSMADRQDGSSAASLIGQTVSHYRIISRLGEGGMGVVYLAHDTQLGRKVALKLLPDFLTKDIDRLRRFEQEARTASALSHPNIIIVHEIGRTESVHFIASEHIEGTTLRDHLSGKGLGLGEVLDISLQVASALAAAHAKGIVHRDIKPENIMVVSENPLMHRERYVKVLDFGIAKLTEPQGASDTATPTRPLVSTGQGLAMGTAPYMSPEQAQGQTVDARTDIWSLAVVIFEMVTGQTPFEGPTISHVIVSILEKEPPALRTHLPLVPETLEWIVAKGLRKNREERYQTANELLSDLKDLKQRLDLEDQVQRSASSAENGKGLVASGALTLPATAAQTVETSEVREGRSIFNAQVFLGRAQRHKRTIMLVAALLVTTAALLLGIKYVARNSSLNRLPAPFTNVEKRLLTSSGKASSAAISPDGKYVVHVMLRAGQPSLWLRHVATGSDKEIVPSNGSPITNLIFSPEGNYVYFIRKESAERVLNRVPPLGNATRRVLTDIDTTVTFSPDGQRLAFIRGGAPGAHASLIVANADGTDEQKLITYPADDLMEPIATAPAWSPDGERIAFGRRDSRSGTRFFNVLTVEVKDRKEKQLTFKEWSAVEAIGWLHDGRGLAVTADQGDQGNTQIWYVSYPAGEVRQITKDFNNYRSISLTSNSDGLVTVMSEGRSDIWSAPVGDTDRAPQITTNRFDGIAGIAWTPDGKIVHVSRASGKADIWIMNADGTEDRQLTSNAGWNNFPQVSADGRYIVFTSNRAGSPNIWRMDIDGNNPKQLTHGTKDWNPLWSVDGKSIIFTAIDAAKVSMWKVSIDGGNPIRLNHYFGSAMSVSPKDGKIACRFVDEQAKPPGFRVGVLDSEGAHLTAAFDLPNFLEEVGPRRFHQVIDWTADGQALTYLERQSGVENIWSQRLDGGPPRQLTNFKSDLIFYYKWSRDGKQFAVARGTQTTDVVLITDLGSER